MPKYDDAQYDAGGDSFGSIFADLLAGAAGTVAGASSSRGGVFQDFVEFLERNVDGYSGVGGASGGSEDDAELTFLLQTGSVDDIGEELDETELVVQQLSTKRNDLDNELIALQADLAGSSRFSEKIALEERVAECQARKGVVDKYLGRARKRLLSLQTRYKQLIVGGANDSKAGGRSRDRNTWDSSTSTPNASASTRSEAQSSSSTRQTTPVSDDTEDAWKSQGFGSNGRGRGSGRRRAPRSTDSGGSQSTSSDDSPRRTTYETQSSSSFGRTQPDASSRPSSAPESKPDENSSSSDYNVPPHRRSGSNRAAQDDTERLRQLKVDDEFEKLKKELGL